jgi:hypothetical protein
VGTAPLRVGEGRVKEMQDVGEAKNNQTACSNSNVDFIPTLGDPTSLGTGP